MSWGFYDKLFVFAACVMLAYKLSSGFGEGPYVIWILLALGILLLTELKKGFLFSCLLIAAILVAAVFIPPVLIVMPMSVYAAAASINGGGKRSIVLAAVLYALFAAEAFLLFTDPLDKLLLIVAGALPVYPAMKTAFYDRHEHSLRERYDDAREDSINARRLGEEIMKNADNEIYLARLKERNRIAREIHDNVGHMITRVIIQLRATSIINKDPKVEKQLESISETLDLAMTGIRKSVHELHDDSIDLSIAIREIAGTLPETFDTGITTSIESPADNNTKSAILGIIREAVTNISKYSRGKKVRIEVIENNSFWRVRIWDDGPNPDREYTLTGEYMSSGGLGLKNIGVRAKSLGGRATARSNAGGFEIIATLPKTEEKKNDQDPDS